MPTLLRMPELAASASTATLSEWAVPEGGSFAKNHLIAVVETDKAQVEVTGDADGSLLKILVAAGVEVQTGEPIAVLGVPGDDVSDVSALLVELGLQNADSAARGAMSEPDDRSRHSAPEVGDQVRTTDPGVRQRIFASPLARRVARDAGLSLADVTGTGPGGRIVRRDVVSAIGSHGGGTGPSADGNAGSAEPTALPDATPAAPERPVLVPAEADPTAFLDVPHPRVRKVIATRLTESVQSAPHFYMRAECNVDELLALREEINGSAKSKVSITDLVVKAVAKAHVLVPEMNVVWMPDAIRQFSAVDIGVAVATVGGVIAPVVRQVDSKSLSTVAADVRRLAEEARSARLMQTDLQGGSITVTNLGMYGAQEFSAIINPPQAAILAVGAVREQAMVIAGEIAIGRAMTMVLSVDHRPIDGAVAARWIGELTRIIRQPIGILV